MHVGDSNPPYDYILELESLSMKIKWKTTQFYCVAQGTRFNIL